MIYRDSDIVDCCCCLLQKIAFSLQSVRVVVGGDVLVQFFFTDSISGDQGDGVYVCYTRRFPYEQISQRPSNLRRRRREREKEILFPLLLL